MILKKWGAPLRNFFMAIINDSELPRHPVTDLLGFFKGFKKGNLFEGKACRYEMFNDTLKALYTNTKLKNEILNATLTNELPFKNQL